METRASPTPEDRACQDRILQGVSRTFALTIPLLPPPLARVAGNAYLLCRVADTIEDDKHMPGARKRDFIDRFIRVVAGESDARAFAQRLHPELSPTATDNERDLVRNLPAVVRVTHGFSRRQRDALQRCIGIMADGMSEYQEANVRHGLADQRDLDRYCYFVAGVVGEMLTELFCEYSDEMDGNRDELMKLAVSFGQGLQMTNILKDVWDDQKRNVCWLPRSVLKRYGVQCNPVAPLRTGKEFQRALQHLIGVARAHLTSALHYTLLIPGNEVGIRRFCLRALGMAVLTLRNIDNNRGFTSEAEVKISRRAVRTTIVSTNLLTRRDDLLRWLFHAITRNLPAPDFDCST